MHSKTKLLTKSEIKRKIEFGDFQTPIELSTALCLYLFKEKIFPQSLVEPTCGEGHFVTASLNQFDSIRHLAAYDIPML